jgi:hypothetical protein
MLWPNDIKEELSLAYVHAVATRAGFAVEGIKKDRDSVDLKILARGRLDPQSSLESPELSVQLKATQRDISGGDNLHFDLPLNNYADLTKRAMVPRILVVFFMPEDETEWVTVTNESLIMRRSAFWMSLLGFPPSTNTTSQRVHLPPSQGFDPDSLRAMLARVSQEVAL